MRKFICALLLVWAFCPTSVSQESYSQMVKRFDYDRSASLDLKQHGVVERDGVKIYDISYASLKGGRVPAYMVVPKGRGPFAAVLFGHWAMPGSPMRNRTEFLDEAVAFARAGAVSLLTDAPLARPGYVESKEPFDSSEVESFFQQIMDFRRGVDLLIARKDVDPSRLAYVGHSYNAHVGGVLAGVEKRIKTFVLMAGSLSDAEVLRSDYPAIVKLRESVGDKKIEELIAKTRWLDPAHYIGHAAPSSVLLQYARVDGYLTEAIARHYLEMASEPKALKIYEAGHALNAQARRDRYEWLRKKIGLGPLDPAILDKVKEVK